MRTVVVLNGGPAGSAVAGSLDLRVGEDVVAVVAADSGLHLADRLGVVVNVVVGDMDSVDPDLLSRAETDGAAVHRHPADKDATDLELALEHAVAQTPDRILVVGGASGRLDHLLATVHVLASPRWAGVSVDAHLGDARLHVVRAERRFACTVGETVSLLAVGGVASGVRTTGLRWVLDEGSLEPGSALGVSNEAVAVDVVVDVAAGCVVVVRPGGDGRSGSGSGSGDDGSGQRGRPDDEEAE